MCDENLLTSVLKDDYAKWMVDDPRVNFAISSKADTTRGLNHFGIQAEQEDELERASAAARSILDSDDRDCVIVIRH